MAFLSEIHDWAKTKKDSEVVQDYYGNRVYWGVLKILKAKGYYNNKKKKSATMNGTPFTYGHQYSIEAYANGTHADPNQYEDE